MKKIMLSMLFMAAAAMTTVSCSNDTDLTGEIDGSKATNRSMVLIASNPEVGGDTRTQLANDGKTPLWIANDELMAISSDDRFDEQYTRWGFNSTNKKPDSKATFVIDNASASYFDYFLSQQYFFVYHGGGYSGFTQSDPNDNTTAVASMNSFSQQTPKKGQFDPSNDILISKIVPIDSKRDYEKEPVQLSFKRLTGVLKINILAAESKVQQDSLNGLVINGVSMTTNNADDNFAGNFTVTLKDGMVTKAKGKGKGIEAKNIKGFKIGDGNSIYMSVLPTTIKADKPLSLVLNCTNGKKFKKEVVLPEDITIPDGCITTLNIRFSDPDLEDDPVPGADNKVKVSGNTIDMSARNATGTLYKWHVKEALKANPEQLIIYGPMNALDFNILFSVLRKIDTPIDLDLTNVIIKGSSKLEYTDYENKERHILADNRIPSYFFVGCKLSSIELPETANDLGAYAFKDITTLESATLGSVINENQSGNNIFEGCTGMKDLYVFAYPIDLSFDTNFYVTTNADSVTEKVNVYVYYEWDSQAYVIFDENYYADPAERLWYGYTWKSVTLIDENGNPVDEYYNPIN